MKQYFLPLIILLSILGLRLVLFYSENTDFKAGDKIEITHRFLKEPRKSQYSQTFWSENVKVVLERYPEYHYGDKIEIEGWVELDSFINSDSQLIETLVVKEPRVLKLDKTNFILRLASSIRRRVVQTYSSFLPNEEAALLAGIVLGVGDGIGRDLYEDLQLTGVLHVVVASGSNVVLVGGLLFAFFTQAFKRRNVAVVFTIAGISFYALLAGLDPPIIRATLMAVFSFGALLLGRQSYAYVALILSGFVMLMVSPDLIEDIGFLLSFGATFGILSTKLLIDRLLVVVPLGFLKDDISTTISAQIGVLPVMLFAFNTYSFISIPVNAILLWTIPILMLIGGVAAILGLISSMMSLPFLYLSYPLLLYFKTIVVVTSEFSQGIEIDSFPILLAVGYYMLLIAVLLYLQRNKS